MNLNVEMPPPPINKNGWPWSCSGPQQPEELAWPKISIVTPSFNQGRFIERAIRSVHGQGYPNLEHIIIDGGSTDETVDVIRKYEPFLKYWVSEKDAGQTHAINKGILRSSGEILNWLNCDDMLYEGALFEIAREWRNSRPYFIVGSVVEVDSAKGIIGQVLARVPSNNYGLVAYWESTMPQPSTFVDRSLFDRFGLLREDLHYRMDWEFYLRVVVGLKGGARIATLKSIISEILYHPDCKSVKSSDGFRRDALCVWRELMPKLPLVYRWKVRNWISWLESMLFIDEKLHSQVGLWSLFIGVLRHPKTWPYRYTWGALKKRWLNAENLY